jgi:integrative and conjugative element protein (TIGR02256 family)
VTARLVWLRRSAERDMHREADKYPSNETGGLLLGWTADEQVVIDRVIGPGPDALHRPRSFLPDQRWHEEQLAAAYGASGGRLVYLGDWHTHPGGPTTLSMLDKRTLCSIATSPEARAPAPIMAVLAGGKPWKLAVWQMTRRGRSWGIRQVDIRYAVTG